MTSSTLAGDGSTSLLSALWSAQSANFPQLPPDAPPELRKVTVEVTEPEHVYSVYKASRRYHFQLLVEQFTYQIRYGCDASYCDTPTCFTCRRRIAGARPIRKFSATSVRTLACHLASQDNPEAALCPRIGASNVPITPRSPALKARPNARTVEKHDVLERPDGNAARDETGGAPIAGQEGHSGTSSTPSSTQASAAAGHENGNDANRNGDTSTRMPPASQVRVDPRSFVQNLFNSDAFKMLEWLAPNRLDVLVTALGDVGNVLVSKRGDGDEEKPPVTGIPKHEQLLASMDPSKAPSISAVDGCKTTSRKSSESAGEPQQAAKAGEQLASCANGRSNARHRQHNSSRATPSPRVRSMSSSSAMDGGRRDFVEIDKLSKLERARSFSGDNSVINRKVYDIHPSISGKRGRFGLSPLIKSQTPSGNLDSVLPTLIERGSFSSTPSDGPIAEYSKDAEVKTEPPMSGGKPDIQSTFTKDNRNTTTQTTPSNTQALSVVTPQIADLMARIAFRSPSRQMDSDKNMDPTELQKKHWRRSTSANYLVPFSKLRVSHLSRTHDAWSKFNEQSVFYIMHSPKHLLRSFVSDGTTGPATLFDNKSLGFCLSRLHSAAPEPYLNGLWMCAESLFRLPGDAAQSDSGHQTEPDMHKEDFTNLASIMLNALVAMVPYTGLEALSRTSHYRAKGMSSTTKQELTLVADRYALSDDMAAYMLVANDIYSDELAIRFARRLFAAIAARNAMDDIQPSRPQIGQGRPDGMTFVEAAVTAALYDVERPCMAGLCDGLGFAAAMVSEKRTSLVLMNWCRQIMFQEWNGTPEVSSDGPFAAALAVMAVLWNKRESSGVVSDEFLTPYFADRMDLVDIPVSWASLPDAHQYRKKLHLLDYPFLFDSETLVTYFRAINFSRMNGAFDAARTMYKRADNLSSPSGLMRTSTQREHLMHGLLQVATSAFLVIRCRRSHALVDAFNQLWHREERELLRPLKIKLGEERGEAGSDSGGVQQEFFRLAIAEALNADYGLFTVDPRTRMAWFRPNSIEPEWKFQLVGLLVSLAIYNGLTLPVTFPMAMYRKLLNYPVTNLEHISDGWSDLAAGLQQLKDWNEENGSVEDIFCRTYEFTVDVFGRQVSRDMTVDLQKWPSLSSQDVLPNISEESDKSEPPMVTGENRGRYIEDHIYYMTDLSIRPQFEAFQKGFNTCLEPKSLGLFTPELLQSVVEGVQTIDIDELKAHTKYMGFAANSTTIQYFWQVVKEYNYEQRRRLLEFVTASDRVPVGGMKNVTFVVQKHGADQNCCDDTSCPNHPEVEGRLPIAYTCYGTLLLPVYLTKERLRRKLGMAIENSKGFGFA